jgi:hypothetical protein
MAASRRKQPRQWSIHILNTRDCLGIDDLWELWVLAKSQQIATVASLSMTQVFLNEIVRPTVQANEWVQVAIKNAYGRVGTSYSCSTRVYAVHKYE